MPPFVPTAEQRGVVRMMAGYGAKHADIAAVVVNKRTGKSISQTTLVKHFADELAIGAPTLEHDLVNSLVVRAKDPRNPSGGGAAMFLLKCRFGWRETKVAPIQIDAGDRRGVDLMAHVLGGLARKVAEGEISAGEFEAVAKAFELGSAVIERSDFESRLRRAEEASSERAST